MWLGSGSRGFHIRDPFLMCAWWPPRLKGPKWLERGEQPIKISTTTLKPSG
jgi:hypothetical protein